MLQSDKYFTGKKYDMSWEVQSVKIMILWRMNKIRDKYFVGKKVKEGVCLMNCTRKQYCFK